MAHSTQTKRKRLRLWLADPHCHWCQIETRFIYRWDGSKQEDDDATVDHLYQRNHPMRSIEDNQCVLACYRCNNTRHYTDDADLLKYLDTQPIGSIAEKFK